MIGTLPLIAIFTLTVCLAKTFGLTCSQVIVANIFIIGVIYRHSHNNGTMFLEKLEETLYAINQVSTNCCILGDINIDLLNPQDPLTVEYTNILHHNTIISQISKPTRITNISSTIIDHILINNCNVSVMRGILRVSNH